MASVVPISRSLPAILLDLSISQARLRALAATVMGREPDANEDKLWSSLDDRIDALRAEADAAFLAATGISWVHFQEVRA